jgi:hypothetical protein
MIVRLVTVVLVALALLPGVLPADDKLGAGTFKGTWSGGSANGDFRLTLRPDAQGKLGAEVGFSLNGEDVACKIISVKVDGANLTMVYEFDLQGNKLQSQTQGTLKGKALEGTYKTMAGDTAVDEGTWKTAAQ